MQWNACPLDGRKNASCSCFFINCYKQLAPTNFFEFNRYHNFYSSTSDASSLRQDMAKARNTNHSCQAEIASMAHSFPAPCPLSHLFTFLGPLSKALFAQVTPKQIVRQEWFHCIRKSRFMIELCLLGTGKIRWFDLTLDTALLPGRGNSSSLPREASCHPSAALGSISHWPLSYKCVP